MANISVNRLLKSMQRKFKLASVDNFDIDFLDALRRTVGRINVNADLETRITMPDNTQGTLNLDDAYEYVVTNCLIVELWKMGLAIRGDKDNEFALRIERRVDDDIDMIRQDILNQARDDDPDDEDDLVALGGLGD